MKHVFLITLIGLYLSISCSCSSARTEPDGPIASPVYDMPADDLYKCCVLACYDYFHRVDKQDKANLLIFVNNKNFWAGDTDVSITLRKLEKGFSVETQSHGAGFNQPLWNRSAKDINGFNHALSRQVALTKGLPIPEQEKPAQAESSRDL